MSKSPPIYDPAKRRCIVHQILKNFLSTDAHMQALWVLEDEYAKQHSLPILEYIDQIEKISPLGDKKKELRENLTKELYFSDALGEDPLEEMERYKRITEIKVRKITPAPKPVMPVSNVASSDEATDPDLNQDHQQDEHLTHRIQIASDDVNQLTDSQTEIDKDIPVLAELVSTELVIFTGLLSELNKQFTKNAKDHVQKFYGSVLSMATELDLSPDVETNLVAWCQNKGQIIFNDILATEEMTEIIHACYLWAIEYFGPEDADAIFVKAIHIVERLPEATDFSPSQLM